MTCGKRYLRRSMAGLLVPRVPSPMIVPPPGRSRLSGLGAGGPARGFLRIGRLRRADVGGMIGSHLTQELPTMEPSNTQPGTDQVALDALVARWQAAHE